MSLLFDAMLANRRRNETSRKPGSTQAAATDAAHASVDATMPPAGTKPQQSVAAMVDAAPTLMFVQAPEDTQIAMIADEDLTVMRLDDDASSTSSPPSDPSIQAPPQAAIQQEAIDKARATMPPTSNTLDLDFGGELNLDDLDLQLPTDEELAKMLSDDPELAALGLDTPSVKDAGVEQGPEMPMSDEASITEFATASAPKNAQGAQQYAGFEDEAEAQAGATSGTVNPLYIDPAAATDQYPQAADELTHNDQYGDQYSDQDGEPYDNEGDERRGISNKQWVLAGLGVLAVAAGAVGWKMFYPLDFAPQATAPVHEVRAPAAAPVSTVSPAAPAAEATETTSAAPGSPPAQVDGQAGVAAGVTTAGTLAVTPDSSQPPAGTTQASAPPEASAGSSAPATIAPPTSVGAPGAPANTVVQAATPTRPQVSPPAAGPTTTTPPTASVVPKDATALPAGSPGRANAARDARPDSPLPQAMATPSERKPAADDMRSSAKIADKTLDKPRDRPESALQAPAGKDPTPARAVSSESQTALLDKASEALDRGDFTLAQKTYELATLQDKRSVDAWVGRGTTAQKLGRLGEAEQSFKRALELDPRNNLAQAGLATLRVQAEPKRADPDQRPNTNRESISPSASFTLGNQMAAQGRWQEAQQAYFQAYSGDPGHPDYLVNLAISLDHLRQPGQALQFYRKAMSAAETRSPSFNPQQIQKRIDKLSAAASPASSNPAANQAASSTASQ